MLRSKHCEYFKKKFASTFKRCSLRVIGKKKLKYLKIQIFFIFFKNKFMQALKNCNDSESDVRFHLSKNMTKSYSIYVKSIQGSVNKIEFSFK